MISCLTLVLIGPGIIAFYQTLNDLYHDRDIAIVRTYAEKLRDNFLRGLQLLAGILIYIVAVGSSIFLLFSLSHYLGYLAVILTTFSAVLGVVYVLLFSLLAKTVRETLQDSLYVTLSGFANGIILFVMPVVTLLVIGKFSLFLFIAIGFSVFSYLQVLFFNKMLLEEAEQTTNELIK